MLLLKIILPLRRKIKCKILYSSRKHVSTLDVVIISAVHKNQKLRQVANGIQLYFMLKCIEYLSFINHSSCNICNVILWK